MKKNYMSLIIMIVISVVSQVLSLMKSSVVAGIFGTSAEIDAYNLANSIVSFLFGFVAAGISTIIIPEYATKRDKRIVNSFITLIYGSLIFVIFIMILFRYQIVGMFTNRNEIFINIVANIMVVLLLSQYISSVSNITVAFFQCEGKYNIPKIINLIFQIVVVICLIIYENITIMGYALILSLGIILNCIFDALIALKCGWRYSPILMLTSETKKTIAKFFPMIVSTGVYRVSLMVDSIISATLDEGLITILSYSTQISTMIDSILVGNLLIYIYPKITKTIKTEGSQTIFWKETVLFHSIVCLIVAGFINVGHEGIRILFQHGKFTREACEMVYIASTIYVLGHQTSVIRDLIYRYFYAIGDTKTPATNSVLVSIANIILSIIFVIGIGFYGIILGTIISSFISLIIIFIRFGNKIGFSEKYLSILKRYIINLIIMILTIIIVITTKCYFVYNSDLIAIVLFGAETVAIYIGLTYIFNKDVFVTLKNI